MHIPVEHPVRSGPLGYSAAVRIELVTGGRTLQVAQSAHEWVVMSSPEPVPHGPATLVLRVDADVRQWDVEVLPHAPGSRRVPIRDVA